MDKIAFGLPTISKEDKGFGIERGLDPISRIGAHEKEFLKLLREKEAEATKSKKPFCRPCALEDFKKKTKDIIEEIDRKRIMGQKLTSEELSKFNISVEFKDFESLKQVGKTEKTYQKWSGGEPITVIYEEYRCPKGHGVSIQKEEIAVTSE